MGRKRKKEAVESTPAAEQKQPPNRSEHRTLNVRLEPWLAQAFECWMDSLRPQPTLKSAVEMILEEFLRAKGFIPEVRINHTDD